MNSMTIGQYYPVKSVIHDLDPRLKLLSVMCFVVALFISNSFLSYLVAFVFLLIVVKLSNVPFILLIKSLKSVMFILIFTLVLNIFFSGVGTPIFQFGIIKVSLEGIALAIKMTSRLAIIIFASSLLTFTTSAIKLTDGFEYLFKPLKIFKFPAHDVAMMMTIALRFIPTLVEELDKIMKAQMARGASFDNGSIIKRAKSLIPVLVPLFVSSFRRADELAMAMESRCYRGEVGRTRMKELKFTKNDFYAMIIMILVIFLILFIS